MSSVSEPARPAPVALFVYNRPLHTERTLEALRRNRLADGTDLYVFSDGPKPGADRTAIGAVRALFENLQGFRSVTMRSQEHNRGLGASIIAGVSEVLAAHDRVIVIEDDLETHPETLAYFNRALAHFGDHAGVFSVSGYSYPPHLLQIPQDYPYDVYAIPRMQCWGWATWRDRWAKADFSVPDFASFDESPAQTAAYAHWIGSNSLATLRACMAGQKDVWACRWLYAHFRHHAVCVCPTRSFIDNTGLDGSGTNCGPQSSLQNLLEDQHAEALRLPDTAFVDPRIFQRFMPIADPGWRPITMPMPVKATPKARAPSLLERAAYWSIRPAGLANRLRQKARAKVLARLGLGAMRTHQAVRGEPSVPLIRLGTDYGGWWVPERGLTRDDVVVSAGAGEDISFDVEVAERFDCRVLILDPTPRAIRHFEATKAAVLAGKEAQINNRPDQCYRANPRVFERLAYRPLGLWNRNTTVRFFEPANPKHVSHSIDNMHGTDGGFDAECVTLRELLRREGLSHVSVLKLDIEGAEFAVIDDLLSASMRPRYLLIEFHPGRSKIETEFKLRTSRYLRRLANAGYRLVANRGWDYVLEQKAPGR